MYKCSCGFETDNGKAFAGHFTHNKGEAHKKIGWVDPETGKTYPKRPRVKKGPIQPEASLQSSPSSGSVVTTKDPKEASIFVVTPKKCEINSMFILIAKHICENEWHWPQMSVDDFIDTYLFHTMKQRGIIIGAYMKVEEGKGG